MYDIHLSAEVISKDTINQIAALGLVEDFLRNNINSTTPHFHASLPDHIVIPDDSLWSELTKVLVADLSFRGCLEEELLDDRRRRVFATTISTTVGKTFPFRLETCRAGEHKACDLHIRVDLQKTSVEALELMEQFNFISFERLVSGVWRRIYSLTFEDITIGVDVMDKLQSCFEQISGLTGQMKLEEVTRFWVHPSDAMQLPIVRNADANAWLRVIQ
jgi:hypothetical protein